MYIKDYTQIHNRRRSEFKFGDPSHFSIRYISKEQGRIPIRDRYVRVMDMISWCKKSFGKEFDRWSYSNRVFEFKNEEDATLFKLAWSYDKL